MRRFLELSTVLIFGIVIGIFLVGIPVTAQRGAGGALATQNGDTNGDGVLDISDAVYLLLYLFKGERAPVAIAESPELLTHVASLDAKLSELTATLNTRLGEIAATIGSPPIPCKERADRFIENGDGTVTDQCTGLMWQQVTADLNKDQQWDASDTLNWDDAVAYCENLTLAGHSDWRLPAFKEFLTIVDSDTPFAQAVDSIFGIILGASWPFSYWTSTPNPLYPDQASWVVNFTHNQEQTSFNHKEKMFLIAVRDAQ